MRQLREVGDLLRKRFEKPKPAETDPIKLLGTLRQKCVDITAKLPNRFDWTHINSSDVISPQPASKEIEEKINTGIAACKKAAKKEVETADGTTITLVEEELRPASRSSNSPDSPKTIGLHLKNPLLKVGIITYLPLSKQGIETFNLQVFFDPGTEDQRKFRRTGPMASLRAEEAVIINYCLSQFLEGTQR